MRLDPGDIATSELKLPPATGPGSGKAAWQAVVLRILDANKGLSVLGREQIVTISELRAEIELLRRRIAARRPVGGRSPLPDEKVARIEAALRARETTRSIARRFHVSAMTVCRVGKRMRQREALIP